MDAISQEIANFESIVPFADEATMVLKAHLLMEQSLWKFISKRIPDEKLIERLRNEYSPVATGKALIQLAEALASRDEISISQGEKLWPMLYKVADLRNRFVHDLEPSRDRVEKYMRQVVDCMLVTPSGQLTRDFYSSTMLMIGYLMIDRDPLTLSDVE